MLSKFFKYEQNANSKETALWRMITRYHGKEDKYWPVTKMVWSMAKFGFQLATRLWQTFVFCFVLDASKPKQNTKGWSHDWCSSLFYGLSDTTISIIQTVHHACAKFWLAETTMSRHQTNLKICTGIQNNIALNSSH